MRNSTGPAISHAYDGTERGLCLALLASTALVCVLSFGAGCGVAGSECNSNGDCSGANECIDANRRPVCGIPPRIECTVPSGCSNGVCHAQDDPCSQSGVGAVCGQRCDAGFSCQVGFKCSAEGRCEAQRCDDGWACSAHQACDVSKISATGFEHGCVDIPCSDDGQCEGSLTCVNGRCQTGPGTCGEPELVP